MNDIPMNKDNKLDIIKERVIPGLCYAVAFCLCLAGPSLMVASLVLAMLSGDSTVLGLGILSGAGVGVSGAAALLWCFSITRKSRCLD